MNDLTQKIICFLTGVLLILCIQFMSDLSEEQINTTSKRFTINGLQCIEYKSKEGLGITCNWFDFNRRLELCKAKDLADRTFIVDGEEVIFPPVRGRCND